MSIDRRYESQKSAPPAAISGLAYGGEGIETTIASWEAGVVGFTDGGGIFLGRALGQIGGGIGGYLNIKTAASCRP